MIELTKDKKGVTWIVTKTDNQGFHHQMNLTKDELDDLTRQWLNANAVPKGDTKG